MRYRKFLEQVRDNYSREEFSLIVEAMRSSNVLSIGHKRYDGSPMFMHSFQLAEIVALELGMGSSSVIASLIHECARQGSITLQEVSLKYGETTAKILQGMNSISSVDAKLSTLQADNFRELIISYSTDARVLLIKIADRLEVMRSLGMFPELKRNKKAWETIHIYAPLAHKLGLYSIKTELEDSALMHLEPMEYREIAEKLRQDEKHRVAFIEKFSAPIKSRLDELGFSYKVKGRTKSIYSIWKKMRKQRVPFEKVFDLFAIRIILDCEQDQEKMQCWTTFSVVTDFYTPSPSRMRDWISIPKSNGYESLHSTVLDSTHGEARWVEVQIRSERMDEVAEKGVAAHWRYKEQSAGGLSSEQWLERLRIIVEDSAGDMQSADEFDFAASTAEVFVFTPNGDLRKLPEGATLLDFAFDIHSNLGATCSGGTINGKAVSIKEVLHSGDIVEIKSSKSNRAKVAWLNYVVTGKAKAKIKQILREELASSATLGKEELERKLKNWRLNITLEETVTILCKHLKVKTGLELYDMIAEGRVSMGEIKELTTRYIEEGIPVQLPKPRKSPRKSELSSSVSSDALVIDGDMSGVEYKMAKCCSPIYGDDVFGFVTIHSGITIHRSNCPNAVRLREQFPYRVLEAHWRSGGDATGAFLVTLRVEGQDSQGIATAISEMLTAKLSINVRSINLGSSGAAFKGEIKIEVPNTQAIEVVIYNLRNIKGVDKVYRTQ